MACDHPVMTPIEGPLAIGATNPSVATPVAGSPGLFVSNAPEQICSGNNTRNEGGNGAWPFLDGPWTLNRVSLTNLGPFGNAPQRVRVFLWHVSRFRIPSYFGICVYSNFPGNTSISNIKGHVHNGPVPDISGPGNCLADAQLAGTLDALNPSTIPLTAQTESVIWSAQVEARIGTNNEVYNLIAAVIEFDIVGSPLDITIRSAVSITGQTAASFGNYQTPLADNRNNYGTAERHVRGYWPHADITMNLPGELDATLLNPPPKLKEWQLCYNDNGVYGPEGEYFSVNNSKADKLDVLLERPNPAAYGANLTYRGTFHNYSPTVGAHVHACIQARSVREKYFGRHTWRLKGNHS